MHDISWSVQSGKIGGTGHYLNRSAEFKRSVLGLIREFHANSWGRVVALVLTCDMS